MAGEWAGQIGGTAGEDRVGSRSDFLARADVGVGAGAVAGSDGDIQPAIGAGEEAGAEVECDAELAVGDGKIVHEVSRREGQSAAGDVEQSEGEIVRAVGRSALLEEDPLIGEGRALRPAGKAEGGRQKADAEGEDGFGFHGWFPFNWVFAAE